MIMIMEEVVTYSAVLKKMKILSRDLIINLNYIYTHFFFLTLSFIASKLLLKACYMLARLNLIENIN